MEWFCILFICIFLSVVFGWHIIFTQNPIFLTDLLLLNTCNMKNTYCNATESVRHISNYKIQINPWTNWRKTLYINTFTRIKTWRSNCNRIQLKTKYKGRMSGQDLSHKNKQSYYILYDFFHLNKAVVVTLTSDHQDRAHIKLIIDN